MNWTEISSFDQIPIDQTQTLVICDIDDTLLYFPGLTTEKYNEILDTYKQFVGDNPDGLLLAQAQANNHWSELFGQTKPSHTDKNGFARLLLRLHLYNGGLCFVTARPGYQSNIEFTRSNFNDIYLSYDAFVTYYSSNIPKGEYINKNIDLSGYSNIIFIDDMEHNLSNVNLHFGNKIKCFRFVNQNKKNL